MARFPVKQPKLVLALILGWVIQFSLAPFYHFHPGETHNHDDSHHVHKHEGHLHSHELASIAHALKLHPSDPDQDAQRHHSHSSSEHDSDYYEVDFNKASLKTGKPFHPDKDFVVLFIDTDREHHRVQNVHPDSEAFNKTLPFKAPRERSPPLFSI